MFAVLPLFKLLLCFFWCDICISTSNYRKSIKESCLSIHRSWNSDQQQVYKEKFLSEDDTEWLSAEVRSTYSEMEARSKRGRIHPLSNVPFLTHYIQSLVHTDIIPRMNHHFGLTDRLLGIKDIYFEIQSPGVKKTRETLMAASTKNTGDLTFVILLNNTNAGSGNLQVFNMTTVNEDAYTYDDDSSLLFFNEQQIISEEHQSEDLTLVDHEKILSLDPTCVDNGANCQEYFGSKPYGAIQPTGHSSVVDVQLLEGEGVFFTAQRYYRINPVVWTNGTEPIIYLIGILSIATDHACKAVLSANKTMTLGEAAMAAGSASQTTVLVVVFCGLIVVGAVLALVDRFNTTTRKKRY